MNPDMPISPKEVMRYLRMTSYVSAQRLHKKIRRLIGPAKKRTLTFREFAQHQGIDADAVIRVVTNEVHHVQPNISSNGKAAH